jgi:betaine reductase
MTNLFDGVSIVIERNSGVVEDNKPGVSEDAIRSMIAESMKDFASHLLGE